MNSAGSSATAGSGGQAVTAGASSVAGSHEVVAGSGGASNLSNASGGMPTSSMGGGAGAGAAPCRDNVAEADWEANCVACGGGDDCAACACTKCADVMHGCETTPGCREIAACVRASACTGAACYCGTVNLLDCANGSGNGPCKDVMLAAPGGKPPTMADPSAGPASDALIAVNGCLQDASTCGPSCN